MQQEIEEYLAGQRVGALAVEMPDGSPHVSTVHFACSLEPLVFYFETNRGYRKSEALFGRKNSRASLVIGFSEEEAKTFQLDGIVSLIEQEDQAGFERVYFDQFPEKKKKASAPDFVEFKFTPTWWRYTDFKSPQGKLIISSKK